MTDIKSVQASVPIRFCTEVTSSRFKAAIHVFLVNSIFGRLAKVLYGLFSTVTEVIRCALKHVVLQKEEVRNRVFHLLNKFKEIFFFNRMNNFEKLNLKKETYQYWAQTLF